MFSVNNSAAASFVVTSYGVQVIKLEATINASADAGLFLQVHDNAIPPADGPTVLPVKYWPAIECKFKEFMLGEISLNNGCYVCLSTTATFKTLATGGSNIMDSLMIELHDGPTSSSSTVGDMTTAVDTLQVWSDAAGPKQLVKVEYADPTGAVGTPPAYWMLFAKDTPVNGDIPLWTSLALGVNQVYKAYPFGRPGIKVFSAPTSNTLNDGCTFVLSDTQATLTKASTGSSNQSALRVTYRAGAN